jgi:hypothetical protein
MGGNYPLPIFLQQHPTGKEFNSNKLLDHKKSDQTQRNV